MCGLDVPHERVQTVKGDWTFEPGRIENGGTMKVAFWALLKGLTRPIKAVYCTALLLWFHTRPHDARLFFSESQFKSFSALTAFDNLTSSNIRPLLRNLLFFCSSWNWYSPLTLYISRETGCILGLCWCAFCLWPLDASEELGGGTDIRNQGVISIADPLSLLRELLCFAGLLIWLKAAYHSDTILSQSAKGDIGHTLIYFLFLFWLWLIRNDSNWAKLFDLS